LTQQTKCCKVKILNEILRFKNKEVIINNEKS